jgi:hypothetical protein
MQGSDRDVAIAPLTERIGEALHLAKGLAIGLFGKARLEDLERRPQATRRDPHVVHPLDVARVEHSLGVVGELRGAHRHDLRGRLSVGVVGGQVRDRLRLGH